jgi:hypothetical protein
LLCIAFQICTTKAHLSGQAEMARFACSVLLCGLLCYISELEEVLVFNIKLIIAAVAGFGL